MPKRGTFYEQKIKISLIETELQKWTPVFLNWQTQVSEDGVWWGNGLTGSVPVEAFSTLWSTVGTDADSGRCQCIFFYFSWNKDFLPPKKFRALRARFSPKTVDLGQKLLRKVYFLPAAGEKFGYFLSKERFFLWFSWIWEIFFLDPWKKIHDDKKNRQTKILKKIFVSNEKNKHCNPDLLP